MEFNHFLSAYYPDTSHGGDRLFADMLSQARHADRLGHASVSIPEHHLINILLTPSPLMMAVKLATETTHVRLMTSVAVLPLHDMRLFAGEVVMADIMTDGRLILGVGRGAFASEMACLGSPISQSREKFDESLAVLQALLSREDVSWSGKYYRFGSLTVMPRPVRPIQMMIASVTPEGIEKAASRGFHVQTTPLDGSYETMREQTNAFHRAKEALGDVGRHLTLSLSRVARLVANETEKRRMVALAHDYYARFDNMFTGPGLVSGGAIEPLPRVQTMEQLAANLIIATPSEMIDILARYQAAGVDEIIFNLNIGTDNAETLDNMQWIAEAVMPPLTGRPCGPRVVKAAE